MPVTAINAEDSKQRPPKTHAINGKFCRPLAKYAVYGNNRRFWRVVLTAEAVIVSDSLCNLMSISLFIA